MSTKQRKFI